MKKRISAFLLSLCLLFGALSGTVSAAEGDQEAAGGELVLDKWVEETENGNFKLRLESYATGTNGTVETKPVPLDIVLVLDESGSMADYLIYGCSDEDGDDVEVKKRGHVLDEEKFEEEELNEVLFVGHKVFGNAIDCNKTYTIVYPRDGTTRDIHYCSECKKWYTSADHTAHISAPGAEWIPFASGDEEPSETLRSEGTDWNCHVQFYERCGKTGQDVLEAAVKGFLGSLYDASVTNPVGGEPIHNRVAMVSYSTNAHYFYPDGRRNALFKDVSDDKNVYQLVTSADNWAETAFYDVANFSEKTTFVNWANGIQVGGRTTTSLGIQAAQLAFQNLPDTPEERAKVMILFTDGAPGSGYKNYGPDPTGKRLDWVTPSIEMAKEMKDAGVTIYSVGLFPSADGYNARNISYDVTKDGQGTEGFFQNANCFLHLMSSNYPEATGVAKEAWGKLSDAYKDEVSSFYLGTSNANELSDIFARLSEELKPGSTTVTLGAESVVKDVITDYFQITDNTKVAAWTESYTGGNGDQRTWKKNEDSVSSIEDSNAEGKLHIQVDGQTVTVTNFDFAANYVHMDGDNPQGKKLVVEIEIKPADGSLGGVRLPTNTSQSAIYESSSTSTPVERFPIPHVDLPTTVTVKKEVIGDDNAGEFSFAADYSEISTYEDSPIQENSKCNYLKLNTASKRTTFSLADKGELEIEKVAVGSTLTIQETNADGYTAIVTTKEGTEALTPDANGKYEIPVTPGMVVTFTNIKYTIQLTKVDKENGTATLGGAEFALEKFNETTGKWEPVEDSKQTTENDGQAVWPGLEAGRYQLTETKAPDGYVKSDSVTEINLPENDPDHDGVVEVKFTNGKAPQTGASGTMLYTAAGLTLLVCAAGVFVVSRKKSRG